MIKGIRLLSIVALAAGMSFNSQDVLGQIPQYYYLATNSGSNLSTFSSNFHLKSQFLYYPSDFNISPVAGEITTVYVRPSTRDTSVYTNFVVKLGMTANVGLVSGPWITAGMDTVIAEVTHMITGAKSNEWLAIPLKIPFNYDGTSNLIFEVSQTAYTGGFATTFSGNPRPSVSRMKYGPMTGTNYAELFTPIFFGFDMCKPVVFDLGADTCFGEGIVLSAGNTTGATYTWNNGSSQPTLQVNDAGTYYVSVTSAEGCVATDTIHIINAPVKEIKTSVCGAYTINDETFTATGIYTQTFPLASGCDSILILDLTINKVEEPIISVDQFNLSTTIPYSTYQWIRDGATIPGATAAIHTATVNGRYQVKVTDEHGCTDTSEAYAITNAGTGIGNNTAEMARVKLYPNPASHQVIIQNQNGLKLNAVTVTNLVGQVIQTVTLNSMATRYALNTTALASGIYLLIIHTDAGQEVKKIEIRK